MSVSDIKVPAPIVRRCHATILFSDLCSSTHLAELCDPETLAEILGMIRQVAERVVSKYHGVVNQFYGDGVLAAFGYPTPLEDDVRHAVEAALELHEQVRLLQLEQLLPRGFDLRLHTGVHAGLIVVQEGDFVQGRYKLYGDALNTAARLADAADPDELVVSASTLRGVQPFFVSEAMVPLSLKGKEAPMAAFKVSGRTEINTRFEASVERGLSPLVGREAELEELHRCLQRAEQGALQLAPIIGDAGLGKTRLVEEFLGSQPLQSHRVLRAYCQADSSGVPLQPFIQMLQRHFGLDETMRAEDAAEVLTERLAALDSRLVDYTPELLRVLSLPGSASNTAGDSTEQIVAALVAFMMVLSDRELLIIYIDDWQWADDTSRQILAQLLQEGGERPLLVITASRALVPEDPVMSGKPFLLQPLSLQDSSRAISAMCPGEIEVGVAATLHERAGGNPLFLEELCQSLHQQGEEQIDDSNINDVPVTLHGLIEARVSRLPSEYAHLVRTAAVIGNVVSTWLFERVVGYRITEDLLSELTFHDLIFAGEAEGTLRFKHGITRDVVYESVRLKERQDLHLCVAEQLEEYGKTRGGEEPLEALAYHYAGAADELKAIHYAELAGNKAMASASLDRARQQYITALDALRSLEQTPEVMSRWVAISMRWALASTYSPSREQLDILRRTVACALELGDHSSVAQAQYWLGWINYALGNQLEAIAHYEESLQSAQTLGDQKLSTQLMLTLGQSYAAAAQYPKARSLLDEAIAIKQQHLSSKHPPVGSAYGMACKGMILADQGNFSEAWESFDWAQQAVQGKAQAIEGSIMTLYGAALLWRGRWPEACAMTQRAERVAEKSSLPYVFAMARALAGYARWVWTRDPEGLETLQQASQWLINKEMCLYISFNYGWLADAMATAGQYQKAHHFAQCALERVDRGDLVGETMAYRALARVAANVDGQSGGPNLQSPEYYLQEAMASAERRTSKHDIAVTQWHQAKRMSITGDKPGARQLIEQASSAFSEMDMRWHLAKAKALGESLK